MSRPSDTNPGTRWAHEPHIHPGDPCYHCGITMVPASRTYPTGLLAAGTRRHGSHGLCSRCYARRHKDPAIAALIKQVRS